MRMKVRRHPGVRAECLYCIVKDKPDQEARLDAEQARLLARFRKYLKALKQNGIIKEA